MMMSAYVAFKAEETKGRDRLLQLETAGCNWGKPTFFTWIYWKKSYDFGVRPTVDAPGMYKTL